MSSLHCNFMINTGHATGYDLEYLGETIRKRVFEKSGIRLEWEIKRLGLSCRVVKWSPSSAPENCDTSRLP